MQHIEELRPLRACRACTPTFPSRSPRHESKFPITRLGAELLKAELHRLKTVDRPAVITAIAEARAHGDISENAEYDCRAREAGASSRGGSWSSRRSSPTRR